MDDVLVVPVRNGGQAGLQDLLSQLRQEVVELCREVAGQRREILELRQQAGYWKAQHARAVQRIGELEVEVERLRGENRQLQGQLFGRKSEKSSSSDRTNSFEGEKEEGTPARKRGRQKDRPGPKRRDYAHLPVEEEVHELPPEQRLCPQCGEMLTPSDSEDSEQIEIEVKA